RGQPVREAEVGKRAHAVRQQVDADAQRMDLRRRLEDAARDAGLMAAQGQGQAADAAADDQHIRVGRTHSAAIPRLATTSAQRLRSLTAMSPSAAGAELVGTRPCASNTDLASGLPRMAATSLFSRSTISAGVPLGANR